MKSAIISLLLLAKQSQPSSEWDYDHMGAWKDTYSMCDNQDESPIDLNSAHAIYDDNICTADFDWSIDYTKQTFRVTNNGHTVVLKPIKSTNIDPNGDLESSLTGEDGTEYMTLVENDNKIASFPNYFRPRLSKHDEFCLDSLHFHWGMTDQDGSEHFVDGHQYPLEVHFVHYSCSHPSLGATLAHFPTEENVTHQLEAGEDTHQLGVVGIFFDIVEGEHNPAFDALFEDLEGFENMNNEKGALPHIVNALDLQQLIPEDVGTAGYFAYEGSLTTPPCTDIVRWHVMNARGWIGSEQIQHFRALMSTEDHSVAPNYRTLQNNVNDVYGCMEPKDLSEVAAAEELTRGIIWVVAVITMLAPVAMGFICVYQNKKEKRVASENVKTVKH